MRRQHDVDCKGCGKTLYSQVQPCHAYYYGLQFAVCKKCTQYSAPAFIKEQFRLIEISSYNSEKSSCESLRQDLAEAQQMLESTKILQKQTLQQKMEMKLKNKNLNAEKKQLTEKFVKAHNQLTGKLVKAQNQIDLLSLFIPNQTKVKMQQFRDSMKLIGDELKHFDRLIIEQSYKSFRNKMNQLFSEPLIAETKSIIHCLKVQAKKSLNMITKTKLVSKQIQDQSAQLNLQLSREQITEQPKGNLFFAEDESNQMLEQLSKKIKTMQSRHQRILKLLTMSQANYRQFAGLPETEQPNKQPLNQSILSLDNDIQGKTMPKQQTPL